jgi:phage terminase large subunit
MDGINAGRLTIPSRASTRERCKDGIEALKQYRADYDEERKVFKLTPRHDWSSHAADAWRYLAIGWRALKRARPPSPRSQVDAYIGQPDGTIRSHLTFNEIIKRAAGGMTHRTAGGTNE